MRLFTDGLGLAKALDGIGMGGIVGRVTPEEGPAIMTCIGG